jgi:hypothetical protein
MALVAVRHKREGTDGEAWRLQRYVVIGRENDGKMRLRNDADTFTRTSSDREGKNSTWLSFCMHS